MLLNVVWLKDCFRMIQIHHRGKEETKNYIYQLMLSPEVHLDVMELYFYLLMLLLKKKTAASKKILDIM